MAHYLVTGGGGFIGSHLVERLLTDGHRVRVLDNFSNGRRSNIEAVQGAGMDRLQVSTGDIRDAALVAQATSQIDGIFHLAALGSVPRSISEPLETNAVNADGTLNILVAARDQGIKRVVFAGSSSVYGELAELPKREDHPTEPISPYGLTKLIGEHYLRLFNELYDLETVTLRFYNVFGPRQDPQSQYAAVVPNFISKLQRGESPVVHGDGEQSRDFTYVTNVVDAAMLVMGAPADQIAPGLFNVAVGERHTVNELLKIIQTALGTDIPSIHEEPRAGDIKHSQADITRIRTMLGFEPKVSFHDGLQITVEHQTGVRGSQG